ncbi:MAG: hypothetical protein E7283_04005 [Lachnospiraceae bacterium]|nr:hypothetical protein [Lachnospiraceae bacterium]
MATAKKATTKATEVKEVKEVKVEAPKAEKKAPAKKAATTTKKATTAKKETVKKETVITIQHQGNEITVASVEEKVKAAFVADGHKASTIKTLNIYVKPEEYAAYYVINDEFTGRVYLF